MAMMVTKNQQPAPAPSDPYGNSQVYTSRSTANMLTPSGYLGYGNGNVEGQSYVKAGDTSGEQYRNNLTTDAQGKWDVGKDGLFYDYSNDSDADVRRLQQLQNTLSARRKGYEQGISTPGTLAEIDALKARIGLKNSLGSSIRSNTDQEMRAENSLRDDANSALDAGVKNTRQNYNNRGLLYSGLRQGGEQQVRGSVAAKLGGDLADTKRSYTSLADAQKAAYASIGLQQQQQKVDQANQAFDTVQKNQIAKLQAYQQLGTGVGRAAGYAVGSYYGGGNGSNPSNNGSNYVLGSNEYSNQLAAKSYDQILGK
jgi:hypothetical protein